MFKNINKLEPYILLPIVALITFNSCIEQFEPEVLDFESAIVVEATITDEMQAHRIFLTRAFEFDSNGPSPESNANVRVVDGSGNTFVFKEIEPGVYESEQVFAAQPENNYRLSITANGRSYSSTEASLGQATQIDNLRAERMTNDDGEDGVAILLDSFDPSGSSVNYLYRYEESYKIIAPNWQPQELILGENGIELVNKIQEDRICYATHLSNTIIQTSTRDLDEDRVDNFIVRFISSENFIISHRYSILVRQFIQSDEAFSYYETLKKFSSSESLFSETQPGFLEGNVSSDENPNEKVLGYFDVSSVTERRIFFNYEDFYPGEDLPPYADPCMLNAPNNRGLTGGITLNLIRYFDENDGRRPEFADGGRYIIVPRICGDCTVLGETPVPEFWVE